MDGGKTDFLQCNCIWHIIILPTIKTNCLTSNIVFKMNGNLHIRLKLSIAIETIETSAGAGAIYVYITNVIINKAEHSFLTFNDATLIL